MNINCIYLRILVSNTIFILYHIRVVLVCCRLLSRKCYHFRTPDFTPWDSCCSIISFLSRVMSTVFSHCSFNHCIACLTFIYDSLLQIWYFQKLFQINNAFHLSNVIHTVCKECKCLYSIGIERNRRSRDCMVVGLTL